uniref:mediator of RNA polymerase II transcription subunit 16-like n=1 Tax=Ciona intestinalis TaxID=7719 RepID=UPI000180BBE1|nr:mediator of RNA polymerase II transcription subunit 16-like [Ciona intestinalis]|eukprot:XP_018668332.1 mediator of RNA polymerase II transcription subunit 16-like [Ciona intestinalis]
MDPVYEIDWQADVNQITLGHGDIVECAWSASNFFAFTTEKNNQGSVTQYLHILNPNQPWGVFSTKYNDGAITCLQWDHTGTRLVSGDNHGLCCLWTMSNSLCNVWTHQNKHNIFLEGEEILSLGWLHNGARFLFHIDKMESSNLGEKFDRAKFWPTVMQHGGKAMEGFIVVTGSGLAAVRLLLVDGESVESQFRLNVMCHQQIADIAFTSQGKVVVMTTDSEIQHFIQFHEIQLTYNTQDHLISHEVSALPSLQLRCASEEHSPYTYISHAHFVSRENQDHVLICVSGPTGSKFESWLIRKESVQLHRIFQQNTNPVSTTPDVSKCWHYVTNSTHLPQVLNFSIPTLPIDASSSENKVSQESKFFCGFCFAVALADNTIQILHRLFLQVLVTQHLPVTTNSQETTPGKAMKMTQQFGVRHVSFSTLSCAMIAADKHGRLLLYRIPPWLTTPNRTNTMQSLKQLLQLMLYCLVSGKEWWEILLHVHPNLVEPLVKQLSVECGNQTSAVQQVLELRLQALKISIYHITASPVATDLHLKMLFQAISLVFRSLVRPHQQVGGEEIDPATKLQNISRTSTETNIDQLVQNVDTDPQTLQSMQQLIQWVADVALYLLASVPLYKQANRPGYSLYWDRDWLSLLREMLVLIRVWGLLKSACSPVFNVLDSRMDVLSHVFKLVTQLWMASTDDHRMTDLPTSLINECSALPFHIIIPPLEPTPPPNSVLSQMRNFSGTRRFTFGETPQDSYIMLSRQHMMDHVAVAGSSGKVDSLRRIFLGKSPNQELKECVRCGVTTTCNNLLRSTLKVWDQRFVSSCVCGGHWKKLNSHPVPLH